MSLLAITAITVNIPMIAAANAAWTEHRGFNCWDGHGATEIDTYPIGTMSLESCEDKCSQTPGCTTVTFMVKDDNHGTRGNCWRRKDVDVSKCQTSTEFDTWTLNSLPPPAPPAPAPPLPSSHFPTTEPTFMKALVEGLLSDDGTDAKKCENDAEAFAAAMEHLAQTAVGSTKAVAAAVEEAKSRCTPVARDSLKLAVSALGDLFHPGRIPKNFQASRSDILTEIGSALEALAKKDFKGAGNNAGKFTRRLLEGPQDADSLTSNYTKMGDLNCYQDHGATDLEKEVGKSCGEMSISQCEAKCDELTGCQGITTVATQHSGMVLCYRRGNITVGRCDHNAVGYDTFLNKDAQMPVASNAIASIASYVVTYWGAAALTQDNLASESPETWGEFLEGLLEGLMSDGSDFSDCASAIPVVGEAVKTAKEKIGKSLAAAGAAAKVAKQACGMLAGDVAKLAKAAFYDLEHPDQVVQNFQAVQYDVLMDLGQSFIALAKNDYSTAGDRMGMSLRRIIEGKQGAAVLV
jgi:hypothetical protein